MAVVMTTAVVVAVTVAAVVIEVAVALRELTWTIVSLPMTSEVGILRELQPHRIQSKALREIKFMWPLRIVG